MNIGSLFTRHAKYRPDHLAVVFKDKRLTHREFNQSINRLANALLGLGIRKGDKVATVLPNCLELLEVCWAVGEICGRGPILMSGYYKRPDMRKEAIVMAVLLAWRFSSPHRPGSRIC
jgi:acyl-CoA synthetase (AMP-forming)/AMP-acid ligase II